MRHKQIAVSVRTLCWGLHDRVLGTALPTNRTEPPVTVTGHASAIRREGFVAWEGRDLRLFVGWSCLWMALLVLAGSWWLRNRPGNADLPALAMLVVFMAASGATLQTAVHWLICRIHRNLPPGLIITAAGYRAVGEKSWPLKFETAGAAARIVAGRRLAELIVPSIVLLAAAGLASLVGAPLRVAAWTWTFQAVWTLMPIPGGQGRGAIEALWIFGGGCRPAIALLRVTNLTQGMLAILVIGGGLWAWQFESTWMMLPKWPFVIMLGVLIWGERKSWVVAPDSNRQTPRRRSRADERWFGARWLSQQRVRRAQRSERAEAIDEAELDHVLAKLHDHGFGSLSAGERQLLQRVSRRLRGQSPRKPPAPNPAQNPAQNDNTST
jgi:hypothetical protein